MVQIAGARIATAGDDGAAVFVRQHAEPLRFPPGRPEALAPGNP